MMAKLRCVKNIGRNVFFFFFATWLLNGGF